MSQSAPKTDCSPFNGPLTFLIGPTKLVPFIMSKKYFYIKIDLVFVSFLYKLIFKSDLFFLMFALHTKRLQVLDRCTTFCCRTWGLERVKMGLRTHTHFHTRTLSRTLSLSFKHTHTHTFIQKNRATKLKYRKGRSKL